MAAKSAKNQNQNVNISTADLGNMLASVVRQAVQQPVAPVGLTSRFGLTQKRYALYAYKLANDKHNRTTIEIPKIFIPYISTYLTVTHNGSTVKIPVDGRPHVIHKNFLGPIKKKLRHVSEKISKATHRTQTGLTGDIFEVSGH